MRAKWQLPLLREGSRYRTERVTPEAVDYVADHLRAGDRQEVLATSGSRDMRAALQRCVARSASTVVGVDHDGTPVAVLGVATVSLIYNAGSPWMLATDRAQLFRSALVAAGRLYTDAMLEQYAVLENWVDVRNTKSVAWLQHLGYTIGEAKPYGALALPFYHFWKTRN